MKKCELLSPAGNRKMLEYAVQYGADAVYLAGEKYGARKFATNFNNDELIDAVKYCHLYGVKVYVTINTLIYEQEVDDFIEYVGFLSDAGVDAVLVQDMGMLNLIHKIYPDLELHASTQMHNNSSEMLNLLKSLGVKRVVLDREMSIDEIKKLPEGIEREVFCHGALCVSYSGQCLFSSMILNRSGNRGECAGLCRLPYKFENDGKISKPEYHLSLKDLCSLNYIENLLDSKVDSLKIEGRMKSPEYVGYMTKIYRKAIDDYYDDKPVVITDEELKNIKLLFNRGVTKGFLNNASSDEIVNTKSPNHIGITLGMYEPVKNKVKIILSENIHQGDVIRFTGDNQGMTVNFLYDKKDNLISNAKKGETVYVDNFLDIEKNGEVKKVSDFLLNQSIGILPKKHIPIVGVITISRGKKIKLVVSDGQNTVTVNRFIPCDAINKPLSREDVEKQLCKTGNTVYTFTDLKINLDEGLFVNIKELNEIRREALEILDFERINVKQRPKNHKLKSKIYDKKCQKPTISVKVNDANQYYAIRDYADKIYTSDKKLFDSISDSKLIFKYAEQTSKIDLSEYMISDWGALLGKRIDDKVYTDYMLNVVNSYTANFLSDFGVSKIGLSLEIDDEQLKALSQKTDTSNLEILIYGRSELMKMKYLSDKNLVNASLIDRNNERFLLKQEEGMTYLLSNKPINLIDKISFYKEIGITNYRLDFYSESPDECFAILEIIHKNISKE